MFSIFLSASGLALFWTLLALPVMKYYARAIPLPQLALISLWAFGRMMVVFIVAELIWLLGFQGTAKSIPPLLVFAIICIAGWLITRSLKARGIERSFPGIGARAILGILIFMWLIFGAVWLAGGLGHS